MKIPSREQAEEYFTELCVPENVRKHCFLVNKVAVFLAEGLKAKGEPIDLDIVDRLSLLHDLCKPIVIKDWDADPLFDFKPTAKEVAFWKEMRKTYQGMHETEIFYALFQDDVPEFAALMQHYGDHDIVTSKKSREEQIVHYADWRVLLSKIISLKERTDDLFIRYNKKIIEKGKSAWEKRVQDEFDVEKSIFAKLGIQPDALKELVK